MILAADGRKLSKSLKNYPPLEEVFSRYGADSLRLYLLSSPPAVRGDYMRFDIKELEALNQNFFVTLYNSVAFFCLYAQLDNFKPTNLNQPKNLTNLLDKWLVEKVNEAISLSTLAADQYDLSGAIKPVIDLVDDLSNWYIRRSRRRFWKSRNDQDKLKAYQVLYWALIKICQLLSPWSPFISDYLFRHLTLDIKNSVSSVHLTDWPIAKKANPMVLNKMQLVRDIVTSGLSLKFDTKITQ